MNCTGKISGSDNAALPDAHAVANPPVRWFAMGQMPQNGLADR